MISVGLLASLKSGENKLDFIKYGQYRKLKRLKKIIKDGNYGKAYLTGKSDDYLREVEDQVKLLCRDKPDIVALYCGDGGMLSFLTALEKYWPEEKLPLIAHPKGGSFGVVANRLNIVDPFTYLKNIVESESIDNLTIEGIKMMRVKDDSGYEHLSFSVGMGFPVTFLQEINKEKHLKNIRTAKICLRVIFSALFNGEYYRRYDKKHKIIITQENYAGETSVEENDWLGILCQSIESLGVPKWILQPKIFRKAEKTDEAFHTVGTTIDFKKFLLNLPIIYTGESGTYRDKDTNENQRILHIDKQTKSLKLQSEKPFAYQSCGELSFGCKPCLTRELHIGGCKKILFIGEEANTNKKHPDK